MREEGLIVREAGDRIRVLRSTALLKNSERPFKAGLCVAIPFE
jgi:hypothetical protein